MKRKSERVVTGKMKKGNGTYVMRKWQEEDVVINFKKDWLINQLKDKEKRINLLKKLKQYKTKLPPDEGLKINIKDADEFGDDEYTFKEFTELIQFGGILHDDK